MKKWLFYILIITLSATVLFPAVYAASQVQVTVDGHHVAFPDELPYVDRQSNRTMVPARFVSEQLGASTKWDAKLNQVTFTYRGDAIQLAIGKSQALVNGKTIELDMPAVVKNGRTMVPLRTISQMFHAQVEWKPERNLVVVTTPKASPQFPIGTWIWDSKMIETKQDQMLQFASDHDVTVIYLQINRDIKPNVYADFVRSAGAKQIRVEALAGRPDWAYKTKQEEIHKFIAWVDQYNASAKPQERFVGLHFDIEPYLLAEWTTNNTSVLENWMDNLRFIERETRGNGLSISLDVPYWLNKIKVPGTDYSISAWLLEKFDCLVIMDYRNHALGKNGIVDNAGAMLREASTLKKKVVVAVETARSTESDRTSFYAMSADKMEQELQIAHQQLSRYASYAGFAIHDYKSWVSLSGKRK